MDELIIALLVFIIAELLRIERRLSRVEAILNAQSRREHGGEEE